MKQQQVGLLQKKVQDLEVVGVVSQDKFELMGTVALPADFKTKLFQASKNGGGSSTGGKTKSIPICINGCSPSVGTHFLFSRQ